MHKEQAKARIETIEQELAALRQIIDAPGALLPSPGVHTGETYWVLGSNTPRGFIPRPFGAEHVEDYSALPNMFTNEEVARAYAEAIVTFLLLRRQPGTEPANNEELQWQIVPDTVSVVCDSTVSLSRKVARISPCFESYDKANAAISTIGRDQITRMYRTFHHVSNKES